MGFGARRTEAERAGAINASVHSMAALFHALEETAPAIDRTGYLFELASERVKVEGGLITVYRLKEVASWLKELPVMIASATARPDLVRQFFPTLQHKPPAPAPAMPNVTLRQFTGGFGKRRMRERLPKLIERARYEMLGMGQDGLVITYKQHEKAFAEALPGVHVAHWGGFIGADQFRDVRKVLIFGGQFPHDSEIARMASCEAGRIVPIAAPVPTPCRALLATGEGVAFNRMAYADPAAQAVLEGIYDSAHIQAIGRPRGINRRPENPVEIAVCANVPLPYAIASIGRLRPLGKIEKLFATGIVPTAGADMARFHPELFKSGEAGRSAKHRVGGDGELRAAMRRHAGRMPWATDRVIYQAAGQGYRLRDVYVARDQLAEAKATAQRAFDGLARWEVRPFSDGRQPCEPIGEDRFTSLSKTIREVRNALLDPLPDHPAPPASSAASSARAPPS